MAASTLARRALVLGLSVLVGCAGLETEVAPATAHSRAVKNALGSASPAEKATPKPAATKAYGHRWAIPVPSILLYTSQVAAFLTVAYASSRTPEHWNEAPIPALAITTAVLFSTGMIWKIVNWARDPGGDW